MGFWKRPSGKAIILYQGALWRGEPRTFLMAVGWERLISEGAMRTRCPVGVSGSTGVETGGQQPELTLVMVPNAGVMQ